jgi:hypothetical protein
MAIVLPAHYVRKVGTQDFPGGATRQCAAWHGMQERISFNQCDEAAAAGAFKCAKDSNQADGRRAC